MTKLQQFVLDVTVGAFLSALVGIFVAGLIIGARFGVYLQLKLSDRGELMAHEPHRCKIMEAK